MKNLEKKKSSTNFGFSDASYAALSKRKSQVHFWVPTEQYKKLKRIGISKEVSIGDMFNEMLVKYLSNNTEY